MLQDVRFAIRTILARPGPATVVVFSLALGLAASATAVSLLDAIGFRPLAIRDPDAIVQVRSIHNQGGSGGQMSYLDYQDLSRQATAFSHLAFYVIRGAGLSGPEAPPETVLLNIVSPRYFETLGLSPAVGRLLQPADDDAGAAPAVVLSHRLWRRRFGSDPDIVRRPVTLNGTAWQVAGVLPASFTGLDALVSPDIWMPAARWSDGAIARERRDSRQLAVIGRLASPIGRVDAIRSVFGVDPPAVVRAQQEVDAVTAALRAAHPDTNRDEHANVVSMVEVRRGRLFVPAALLWAIVAIVLLVGCANVAGLLLGEGESRRREVAVRAALGASRRRLVRQLLTESLVLSLAAAFAGLTLAVALIRTLPALLPPMGVPLGFEFRLDGRVVVATFVVTLATTLVFGLWPALVASRRALAQTARYEPPRGGSMRMRSLRNVFVTGQIAVTLVLTVSGALLVRSAKQVQTIDPGFRVQPLLLVLLAPGAAGYDAQKTQAFLREVADRVESAPGVDEVSLARRVPLAPNGGGAVREIEFPDRPPLPDEAPLRIRFNAVTPNYFQVMGTRLVRGRAFTDRDGAQDPKVAIVNETMAQRYWPGGDALGRRFVVTGTGAGEYDVVGVVQNGRINQLFERPEPYIFFPLAQTPSSEVTMIVKAGIDLGGAATTVRETVRQIDSRLPISMMTLEDHMRYPRYGSQISATIVTALGAAGLVLALIGLYGTISFVVARQAREIGVRMALGAARSDILAGVMRYALRLTLVGGSAGLILAFVVWQALSSSLYGVSGSDPLTFGGCLAGLVLVALAAAWWPAQRAMRIDPAHALRLD